MGEVTPGDEAIEWVFRDEARQLWRALVVFTGGRREIADDAVAEAFARALAQPSAIRNPRPWLYRTAFRIAAGELRRERRNDPQTTLRPTSPMGRTR